MLSELNKLSRAALYASAAIIVMALGLTEAMAGYRYDPRGRRDPFVPLVGVERSGTRGGVKGVSSVDDVTLQGVIMGDDGKKRAIINGEIMKEGDKIESLSVVSISNNSVKVKIEDAEYEVELYK